MFLGKKYKVEDIGSKNWGLQNDKDSKIVMVEVQELQFILRI